MTAAALPFRGGYAMEGRRLIGMAALELLRTADGKHVATARGDSCDRTGACSG
jgi:hypothetical protein